MQLSLNVVELVNPIGTLLLGIVNTVIAEVNTVLSVVAGLLGGLI